MIRIGIAGFGKIGKIRYEELKKFNQIELVGYFDPNIQACKKYKLDRYDSYEDLLDSDLDAVFLCLFPKFLSNYTIMAINRGIHVFCEKPPARKVSELLQVKKAYAKSRIPPQIH